MSDERREEDGTEGGEQPLDARDWEETRGRAEQTSMHSPPAVTREDVPANILDQTREGEEPYQWHSGRTREHGSEDAVEFIDVKKSFGRNTILNGLNLGLPDGQISMILGPSGTGKSVCIKHMVGLLYPDEGDVLVHGESVPAMADDELFEMRKKFGVLFQDGALFGSMNVYDNTAFPLRQHTDKGEDEIREIVMRRLGEVGLGGALDKMPNELSGRHAQARGLRPGARARPRHRALRRARLGARSGSNSAPVRADHGGARGERRGLLRDHARHHVGAARGGLHRDPLEGEDRRVGAGERALQQRQPVRTGSFSRGRRRAPSGWSSTRRAGGARLRAAESGPRGRRRSNDRAWIRGQEKAGLANRSNPSGDRSLPA